MENEKDFLQTFVLVVFMLSVIVVLMNSCNKDVNCNYDKAFIKWMDGTSEEVQLKSWHDYRDDLQLKTTDGRTIFVHSINCILVKSN